MRDGLSMVEVYGWPPGQSSNGLMVRARYVQHSFRERSQGSSTQNEHRQLRMSQDVVRFTSEQQPRKSLSTV